jgi:hypothetical protein
MTSEFECQDCGSHVFRFTEDTPAMQRDDDGKVIAGSRRCYICTFLCSTPEEDWEGVAVLAFQPVSEEPETWPRDP